MYTSDCTESGTYCVKGHLGSNGSLGGGKRNLGVGIRKVGKGCGRVRRKRLLMNHSVVNIKITREPQRAGEYRSVVSYGGAGGNSFSRIPLGKRGWLSTGEGCLGFKTPTPRHHLVSLSFAAVCQCCSCVPLNHLACPNLHPFHEATFQAAQCYATALSVLVHQ